jgi:hypothetical protein
MNIDVDCSHGRSEPHLKDKLPNVVIPTIFHVKRFLQQWMHTDIHITYIRRIASLLHSHLLDLSDTEKIAVLSLWEQQFKLELDTHEHEHVEEMFHMWFKDHPLAQPTLQICLGSHVVDTFWTSRYQYGEYFENLNRTLYVILKYDSRHPTIDPRSCMIIDSIRNVHMDEHRSLWLHVTTNMDVPDGHWLDKLRYEQTQIIQIVETFVIRDVASLIVSM